MRTTSEGLNQITHFANVEELLNVVSRPCILDDRYRSSINGTKEFTGTKDLAEAIALARRGWTGGNDAIQSLTADVIKRLEGQLPITEPRFGTRGAKLNMSRVIAGHPRPWARLDDSGLRQDAHVPKIVRVVCNISASGAITGPALLMRGAAVIVLVNILQRHRIRCSIDLVSSVTNTLRPDGPQCEYVMRVKADGEYVSADKLAFFLGHASADRRLFQAAQEHEPDSIRERFGFGTDKGGYGLPASATQQGDIYIDKLLSVADWSDKFALLWLQHQLSAQGITLKGV